jgi:hypothetical protein
LAVSSDMDVDDSGHRHPPAEIDDRRLRPHDRSNVALLAKRDEAPAFYRGASDPGPPAIDGVDTTVPKQRIRKCPVDRG